MVGAIWMLAWLGVDSAWDRRGFWREENLFATLFYGDDALHSAFGVRTLPGLALYLVLYSLLGCLFAVVLRHRFSPFRTFLAAVIFSAGWFYFSFHLLWKSAMPLVYLLYADRSMVIGHVIYGVFLARFAAYLPHPSQAGHLVPAPAAPVAPADEVAHSLSAADVAPSGHGDGQPPEPLPPQGAEFSEPMQHSSHGHRPPDSPPSPQALE
jgi:hypothetical protein